MTSSRRDGGSWDLASGVGTTATGAAAARAIATRQDRSLIDDRFAAPLVKAVGIDVLTRVATGETPPDGLVDSRPAPSRDWARSPLPTAWSAEGLLGYLPPDAQDRLLDTITELSAPGSHVATESRPNPRPGDEEKTKERLDRLSERWRAHSFDTDMARLRYFGERNEAAPYLAARGWALTGSTIRDLLAAHDLAPLVDDDMRMGDLRYVSGVLHAAA